VSELTGALEEYLALRRGVGSKLVGAGYALRGLVAELEAAGQQFITTDALLAWATRPASASSGWWSQRLQMGRSFARFLHALDSRHQVPPPGLLPQGPDQRGRHYFCEDEVSALMEAAKRLEPTLRGETYATLIGLLWVTGMRVGEALALDRTDVDLAGAVITVRHAKFNKARRLPLADSTRAALAAYARLRDVAIARPESPAFFLSRLGNRPGYGIVQSTFATLLPAAGLEDRPRLRPRLHDLRRGFAGAAVTDWHRNGLDAEPRLAQLATYLGHVDPTKTYRYLSATPELMGAVASRLDAYLGELP